jgi:hypothetical protein
MKRPINQTLITHSAQLAPVLSTDAGNKMTIPGETQSIHVIKLITVR